MNLTKEQRQRLAREMRKLAMECVNNGPGMADTWCGCAIGISLKRAGLYSVFRAMDVDELMTDPDAWLGIVSLAVRERLYKANPTAVVFPLLALADAIEESEAPQAPEKSLP